ncbi:hypothetical protein ABEB36_003123 [Hypothenemus hampei]|uniref:Uncharacterized protein n=1 Tax=Hypothenemus hampei TaxID=57062 RepID=A0ABD1F9Y5_HYPHA
MAFDKNTLTTQMELIIHMLMRQCHSWISVQTVTNRASNFEWRIRLNYVELSNHVTFLLLKFQIANVTLTMGQVAPQIDDRQKRPKKRTEGVWLNAESESKIFHIITPKKTILSAINIYSVVAKLKNQERFAQYNQDDSYIFMPLSTLLRPKTQKRVMDAFKLRNNCKSAVLQNQKQEMQELYYNLDGVLKFNKIPKMF